MEMHKFPPLATGKRETQHARYGPQAHLPRYRQGGTVGAVSSPNSQQLATQNVMGLYPCTPFLSNKGKASCFPSRVLWKLQSKKATSTTFGPGHFFSHLPPSSSSEVILMLDTRNVSHANCDTMFSGTPPCE